MQTAGETGRLATLWSLAWEEKRVMCVIYRTEAGLRLALETQDSEILSEGFDFQPRALSRAKALRAALKRRGWREES
jgi:hypothetical protein